jgi:hypothetical protein
MSENTINNQQGAATQSEGNGGIQTTPGRTFTQDQVNAIVSERLAQERRKAEPTPEDIREKDLTARENRMACMEFVGEHKYPATLLDVFDTGDADKFKASVDALYKAFPQLSDEPGKTPVMFTKGLGGKAASGKDLIAEAFKPNY